MARRLLAALVAGTTVAGSVAAARTPTGGAATSVVVAARDLAAGHELAAGDVRVVRLPGEAAPARALSTAADATGRTLSGPVGAGEPVTAARLTGPGILVGQPVGTVAAHVAVADPASTAMLRRGDRVSVISVAGEVVASSVVVLALDPSPDGGAISRVGGDTGAGVVLAVGRETAALLARRPADGFTPAGLTVVLEQ